MDAGRIEGQGCAPLLHRVWVHFYIQGWRLCTEAACLQAQLHHPGTAGGPFIQLSDECLKLLGDPNVARGRTRGTPGADSRGDGKAARGSRPHGSRNLQPAEHEARRSGCNRWEAGELEGKSMHLTQGRPLETGFCFIQTYMGHDHHLA